MLKWILDNKEWLFSGAGVVGLASVIGFFVRRKTARSANKNERSKTSPDGGKSERNVKQNWRFKIRAFRLWLRKRFLARVVTDGFAFFEEQMKIIAKSGGAIFTTAIFENYSRGDKVREMLLKIQVRTHKERKQVRFTRLVFLDDPTQELAWIRDFLLLRSEITPDKNGFVFNPVILRIPSSNRPFVHRLMSALPRITLTLIKRDGPEQHFVYVGFPNPPGDMSRNFGIAFRSRYLYEQAMNFINKYCSGAEQLHIQKYTEPQQLPNIDFSESGLTIRILDALQELSQIRTDVCHLGLFGSQSLVYQRQIPIQEKIPHEADIDLLIVIERRADIEVAKQAILQCILQQKLEADVHVEIEWSNIEDRYYEFRRGCHVDIQIHFSQDDYYVDKAKLLGYSIFDGFYTVLYSANDEPIPTYLRIPPRPLFQIDRIALVLDAPEYGLRTAIERLGHVNYISRTDPRRVLWISLANTVWGLSGERPITKTSALQFLSNYKSGVVSLSNLTNRAKKYLEAKHPHVAEDAKKLHDSCHEILEELESLLQDNLNN